MNNKNLMDSDLYELLGVAFSAEESEIKKAYRKKALECHPDKNPDNPKAAELFHELSKALEILTDTSARAAYDKVLNAKKAAKIRHRELDSKRQKLIDDLERREREAALESKKYKTFDERSDAERLLAEIDRLQREGSKLLREEHERMSKQIFMEKERLSGTVPPWIPSENRIKIKWSVSKTDSTNGGYGESLLRQFLKKYGDINELIILNKKGSALVEFCTKEASEMAVELEKGLPENPLTLKWINKPNLSNGKSAPTNSGASGLITEKDYESLVLTKMRQAAERQKLIEQMQKEDED